MKECHAVSICEWIYVNMCMYIRSWENEISISFLGVITKIAIVKLQSFFCRLSFFSYLIPFLCGKFGKEKRENNFFRLHFEMRKYEIYSLFILALFALLSASLWALLLCCLSGLCSCLFRNIVAATILFIATCLGTKWNENAKK